MLNFPRNRSWRVCEQALETAGIRLLYVNNVPQFDEQAAQAIIDNCDILSELKDEKIAAIKAEGLVRIHALLPAIDSFDMLELIREVWLSVAPAARQPTATLTGVINTYTAGRTAIASVQAAANTAQVDAVTPAWP